MMLRCPHEPHRCFSRIGGRTVGGFAALAAFSLHTHWNAPTGVLDLGVGGRQFVGGGQRGGRSPLYQRSSLGKTVLGVGSPRVGGGRPLGTPARLRRRSHHRDAEGGHRPSSGSGAGIHHLVPAQVGGISAAATAVETLGSFDYPPALARCRVALPSRSNLVPEYGSRFRGKKNQVVSLYCNPPQEGTVVCRDEMGPRQTIPRGGHSGGWRAARRPDRYKRKGTVQLLAAFAPHRGPGAGTGASPQARRGHLGISPDHRPASLSRRNNLSGLDNLS